MEEIDHLQRLVIGETSMRRGFRDAMAERLAVAKDVVYRANRKILKHRRERDAGEALREEWVGGYRLEG